MPSVTTPANTLANIAPVTPSPAFTKATPKSRREAPPPTSKATANGVNRSLPTSTPWSAAATTATGTHNAIISTGTGELR